MDNTVDIRQFLHHDPTAKKASGHDTLLASLQKFTPRKITDREKAEFCTQLSVMLQSRISLHRALQVMSRQTHSVKLKAVVDDIEKEIQKGNSFARALAAQPKVFEELFVVTAEVGQESGRLPEVLSHLAQHLEKMNALRKKFLQALTYPALVVSVASFVVVFLLAFIVPTFAEMFRSFQVELPFSTLFVLKLSNWLVGYGPYLLIALIGIAVFFRQTLTSPKSRQKIEELSLKLPLIGDIILKNHVARFCRTLGTLLQSQVSLVEALSLTQRISGSKGIREEIGQIIKHVKHGRNVADPLIDSKLFPPMVAQMIAVGEETSELDAMLLKVAEYYEKDIDGKVDTLSSVIEPVIILFLGILVGGILISMYLPMFELVNVVGGG